MASAGSATAGLRHSFVGPVASDRGPHAKKMSRTPSLPSQFAQKLAGAKQKKRSSGLFESSSDSDSGASSHEPSPTERHGESGERRVRKTADGELARGSSSAMAPTTTRHHMSMPSRENSTNNERKGLFEFDDDGADSVETLRERVKQRQRKKEHEILSLRTELDAALTRVAELGEELVRERKEKEEYAIRTNECQRIIEKRNKQLIKASEKLARLGEQSESQVNELQEQLTEMAAEVERTKSHERDALEKVREEFEEKITQQRLRFESQMERLTLASSEKLRLKEAEEIELHKRIARLEEEVVGAASRIAESSEYQILLKRCEDAEAISRGLRFQLEKAQNEKTYLRTQLQAAVAASASQKGTASPAFVPSVDLFGDNSRAAGNHSPASSVASVDLSSFDFARSPPMSPVAARVPAPQSSPGSTKPNLKVVTGADLRRVQTEASLKVETRSKDSGFDSRDSVDGSAIDGDESDPPPMPTLTTSQSDRTESKARPGSGTINFFEKISSKFKRVATSPRNSAPPAKQEDTELKSGSLGPFSASSQSPPDQAGTTPVDIPTGTRRKVLSKRPKMYVAKSPSDYEESSDSIFGSDSDSDASSNDDDDDQPPLPPPKGVSRSPTGSVDLPPPLPPLFGDGSDGDSSSLSDDEEPVIGVDDLRRVILPTPMSPPAAPSKDMNKQKPMETHESSSSAESDSEHTDSSEELKAPTTRPIKGNHINDSKESAMNSHRSNDSGDESKQDIEMPRPRVGTDEAIPLKQTKNGIDSRKGNRERSRSSDADTTNAAAAKVNRMNEYMEARARKRQEKLSKKEERELAEHKKREEYEKEWERMAEEERERRRKQQKARRTGKRRPSSMKTVRVSQMRQHMSKQQKDAQVGGDDGAQTKAEDSDEDTGPPRPERRRSDYRSSDSDSSDENDDQQKPGTEPSSPPLPPEPTAVDTDLYLRQQARLREHHEMELKKKQDSEEADLVRGQIHRRVEMWAYAKELLHMILTLDQISSNEALRQCQLMVVQSPDPETLRKAYRNIIRVIHPDKLRNATVTEQLEAKELFTVLNQAFEKFKAQQQ